MINYYEPINKCFNCEHNGDEVWCTDCINNPKFKEDLKEQKEWKK